MTPLLAPPEAAAYLGITVRGLYQRVHAKTIPFLKMGSTPGSKLRFCPVELRHWLETGELPDRMTQAA